MDLSTPQGDNPHRIGHGAGIASDTGLFFASGTEDLLFPVDLSRTTSDTGPASHRTQDLLRLWAEDLLFVCLVLPSTLERPSSLLFGFFGRYLQKHGILSLYIPRQLSHTPRGLAVYRCRHFSLYSPALRRCGPRIGTTFPVPTPHVTITLSGRSISLRQICLLYTSPSPRD